MFDLQGKTAVVTGAKQGIGRGIAFVLAKAGANVVVSDLVEEGASTVAKEITASTKAKTLGVGCDVSKKADVDALFASSAKKFGSVDILANNAGVYPYKPLLEMQEADWQTVIDVNLKSVFLCTQAAAKQMIARKKGGKIVNISSIAGFVAFNNLTHYCASKGGIIAFTRASALELAPYKINVNSVAPGATQTPGVGMIDDKIMQGILTGIPCKRMGTPEDIAYAVLFLSSSASDYLTGQTIIVDGGMTIT